MALGSTLYVHSTALLEASGGEAERLDDVLGVLLENQYVVDPSQVTEKDGRAMVRLNERGIEARSHVALLLRRTEGVIGFVDERHP